jgi:hypothetical protein
MMVEVSLLTIRPFAWLFLRFAREGEERQELLDPLPSASRSTSAGRPALVGRPRRGAAAAPAGRHAFPHPAAPVEAQPSSPS